MPARLTVRDLPVLDRPRERLSRLGPEALSEQELLACVLGRGIAGESVLVSAQRVLAQLGSLRGLAAASIEQLAQVHGSGPAKAAQLRAAVEVARRTAPTPAGTRPVIETAEAAAAFLRPHLIDKPTEHFVSLLLDTRHQLIRLSPIAVGTLAATLVHPREVFREAIAASAAAILVAHNHPSGDPEPSAHDVRITKRLADAGALLGIEVLDHLIIATGGMVSLKARGLLNAPSRSAPRAPRRGRPGRGNGHRPRRTNAT